MRQFKIIILWQETGPVDEIFQDYITRYLIDESQIADIDFGVIQNVEEVYA